MEVVPNLGDLGSAIIGRVGASSSLIEARAAAADVGQSTIRAGKSSLELTNRVGGRVARLDTSLRQPAPGRKTAIVLYGSLEEFDHLLMLNIFGTVAGHVECREASRMLAEFMPPERRVIGSLVDPILVHPCEEVVFLEGFEEGANVGTLVRRDNSTCIQQSVCCKSKRTMEKE